MLRRRRTGPHAAGEHAVGATRRRGIAVSCDEHRRRAPGGMRMRPTSTIVGRMLASAGRTLDEPRPGQPDSRQLTSPEPVRTSVVPDGIRACLFDLDGVLTQTSRVHAAAWKQMFDAFLLDWS